MAEYKIYMVTTASTAITVEADDYDEALELAFEKTPYANAFTGYDLGDWMLPSEYNPKNNRPEDDYEVSA